MVERFFNCLSLINTGITKMNKGHYSDGNKIIIEAIGDLKNLYQDNTDEIDEMFSDLKSFILSLELCELNKIDKIQKLEKALLKRYNLKHSSINHLNDFFRKNRKYIDFNDVANIFESQKFLVHPGNEYLGE